MNYGWYGNEIVNYYSFFIILLRKPYFKAYILNTKHFY